MTVLLLVLQGKSALFRDLSSIQLMPSGDADPALVLLRQEVSARPAHLAHPDHLIIMASVWVSLCRCPLLVQFLLRVLTGWVQAIDEGATPPAAPPPPNWPQLCQEVAPLLQVNADVLCRHLVCELYSQGLDLRAEEVRDGGAGSSSLPASPPMVTT